MDSKFTNVSIEDEIQELVEIVRRRVAVSIPRTEHWLPRTDAEFLAKFIRCKKYNVDAAEEAILKYYNNIPNLSQSINGYNAEKFSKFYYSKLIGSLKYRHKDYMVMTGQIKYWDPSKVSLKEVNKAILFLLEEILLCPKFQVHGGIVICDLSGISVAHINALSYSDMKESCAILFNAFPVRIAGIHYVNVPIIFWPVYSLIMKVLPSKIKERVNCHRNFNSLQAVMDPNILPKSFGGNVEDVEAWNEEIVPDLLRRNPCYESYWNGAKNDLLTLKIENN